MRHGKFACRMKSWSPEAPAANGDLDETASIELPAWVLASREGRQIVASVVRFASRKLLTDVSKRPGLTRVKSRVTQDDRLIAFFSDDIAASVALERRNRERHSQTSRG